jgi:hypothetical protein
MCAYDRALASFGLPPNTAAKASRKPGPGRQWLAYARTLWVMIEP